MRWKVAMTEPVLQGVAQIGVTRFLVLPPVSQESSSDDDDELAEEEEEVSDEQDDSTPVEEGSIEDFDIDESFLAASVLSPSRQVRASLPSTPSSGLPITNGNLPHSSPAAAKQLLVSAHPLRHPVPSPLLIPRPSDDEDEIPRIYLKTRDLSRLGIFSGDWAVIESEEDGGDQRVVRCFASDGIVPESLAPDDGPVFRKLRGSTETDARL